MVTKDYRKLPSRFCLKDARRADLWGGQSCPQRDHEYQRSSHGGFWHLQSQSGGPLTILIRPRSHAYNHGYSGRDRSSRRRFLAIRDPGVANHRCERVHYLHHQHHADRRLYGKCDSKRHRSACRCHWFVQSQSGHRRHVDSNRYDVGKYAGRHIPAYDQGRQRQPDSYRFGHAGRDRLRR